jgi:Fe-S cluster assembly protein SufD
MATELATETDIYQEAFQALRERLRKRGGNELPSWMERLRESAFARYEKLGFPNVKQEEWKYTNVAPIAKTKFAFDATPAREFDATRLEHLVYPEARRSRIVFINGAYSARASALDALPAGVVAMNLFEALGDQRYEEAVREHLAHVGAADSDNAFTALNTAFLADGAFIFIPQNVRVESPLHLLFLSDVTKAQTIFFPRVLIIAERDSAATLIESYTHTGSEERYLTNAVVEVVLADGARFEHYKVQREGAQSFHMATTNAVLKRNSSYNATNVTLGAALSRHDVHVALEDEGAECWVDGLYLVSDEQHTDTHSLIDHRKPRCTSHQLYKGILDGRSRAVFNGKIFVREGAQQTDAFQTNRNLLLSNETRVDTKPQLEIFADDVKCSHGATVGQLDEEELFYLTSRGLHPDLARNLLTYGFAEEIVAKIKIESIKAQLNEAVLHRLHARLET